MTSDQKNANPNAANRIIDEDMFSDSITTVRAAQGRLSALSVFHRKSVLYGASVWARRALNSQKRWFSARAVAQLLGQGSEVNTQVSGLARTAHLASL